MESLDLGAQIESCNFLIDSIDEKNQINDIHEIRIFGKKKIFNYKKI
jgi:hypothetical protein